MKIFRAYLVSDSLKKERLVAKNPKFQELIKNIVREYNMYVHGSKIIYQTLPYRAVYKEVTVSDYYIATKVTFKSITTNLDTYLDLEIKWKELQSKGDSTKSPLSSSEYVVIGTKIYRFSDHWGKVASCYWTLSGGSIGNWNIGVADIKDFEPTDDSDRIAIGGYVTLNPEWGKVVIPIIQKTAKDLDKLFIDYDLGSTAVKEINKYKDEFKTYLDKYKILE